MDKVVSFVVRGIPKGQPRGRAAAIKRKDGTWTARVHNPDTAEGWKSSVISAAAPYRPETPIDSPVQLVLLFYLPRPKSLYRRKDHDGAIPHKKAGDVDNYAKAIMDSLTMDGWWRDDCLVWSLTVEKRYHGKDETPQMIAWVVWGDGDEEIGNWEIPARAEFPPITISWYNGNESQAANGNPVNEAEELQR
jgi:Holliday junction resolvase RusA-like endonuclease